MYTNVPQSASPAFDVVAAVLRTIFVLGINILFYGCTIFGAITLIGSLGGALFNVALVSSIVLVLGWIIYTACAE
jgi:hypothetical protein